MKIIIVAALSLFLICDLCVSLNKAVNRKKDRTIYVLDSIIDYALILGMIKLAEYLGRVA